MKKMVKIESKVTKEKYGTFLENSVYNKGNH